MKVNQIGSGRRTGRPSTSWPVGRPDCPPLPAWKVVDAQASHLRANGPLPQVTRFVLFAGNVLLGHRDSFRGLLAQDGHDEDTPSTVRLLVTLRGEVSNHWLLVHSQAYSISI